MPARKPPTMPIRPLYAVPIREAIASGDVNEMKKLSAAARKQIAAVTSALKALDTKITKLSGK